MRAKNAWRAKRSVSRSASSNLSLPASSPSAALSDAGVWPQRILLPSLLIAQNYAVYLSSGQ